MQDINLYQLLKFYAKKWYWILLITLIGVAGGFVYNNYIQTPLYKSSATLILVSPGEKRSTQDVTLINNYIQLFKSRRVLEPAIREQNLNIDYDTLVQSIEATNEKSTEVIKVAISTPSADDSRALVQGSVASFKSQVKALYGLDNVTLVDDASYPERPYNVSKELVFAASGLSGTVVALLGLFFVYDYRLTHKPVKKAKPAKAKTADKKANRKFLGIFRRKQPIVKELAVDPVKKKPAPRKKAAVTKPKTKVIAESTPAKAKKPAAKKSTKQPRKGK